jgi:hypothetical protein
MMERPFTRRPIGLRRDEDVAAYLASRPHRSALPGLWMPKEGPSPGSSLLAFAFVFAQLAVLARHVSDVPSKGVLGSSSFSMEQPFGRGPSIHPVSSASAPPSSRLPAPVL